MLSADAFVSLGCGRNTRQSLYSHPHPPPHGVGRPGRSYFLDRPSSQRRVLRNFLVIIFSLLQHSSSSHNETSLRSQLPRLVSCLIPPPPPQSVPRYCCSPAMPLWPCGWESCTKPAAQREGDCVLCGKHFCRIHLETPWHICPKPEVDGQSS